MKQLPRDRRKRLDKTNLALEFLVILLGAIIVSMLTWITITLLKSSNDSETISQRSERTRLRVIEDQSQYPSHPRKNANSVMEGPVVPMPIMSLDSMVGARLVTGLPRAGQLDELTKQALKEGWLAGVILMQKDLKSRDQIRALTAEIAEAARSGGQPTPIICCDVEGGEVNRLRLVSGAPEIPSARDMGVRDANEVEAIGSDVGRALLDFGINVNLAPVVDLGEDIRRGIMKQRVFASAPKEVTTQAGAFLKGLSKSGVKSVLKHYPGHGLTEEDTHIKAIIVDSPMERIRRHEEPFKNLLSAGLSDSIMLSHLTVTKIDKELPVSLSPQAIERVKRLAQIRPFVWTDSGSMGALKGYSREKNLAASLSAGVDIFLTTEPLSVYSGRRLQETANLVGEASLIQGKERVLEYRKSLNLPR